MHLAPFHAPLRVPPVDRAAAEEAPADYKTASNDEDNVTGAFGSVLRQFVQGENEGFTWRTYAKKLKGRGKGTAEKRYGADIAIEIQVTVGGTTYRKTLLAQAKKEWDRRDSKLSGQARKIASFPGGGIVIDFREGHYRVVDASVAVKAGGDARKVPHEKFRSLGEVLGGSFLACSIGSTSVYYANEYDQIVLADDEGVRIIPYAVEHVVRTVVVGPHSR
jgi:hypothetical protein